MTNSKVNLNENQLFFAFSHTERPYLQALTNQANYLLSKILDKQATKEEKLLYHSIKWALKELGAMEKEKPPPPTTKKELL